MTMAPTLEQIRTRLTTTLKNPAMFSLINTRLILRTGVDLGEIKSADNLIPEKIEKVLSALQAMGFSVTDPS
jgi:hypothetical protein